MDELIAKNSNLPSTIEDLSKFLLVGREKLVSIKAEIKAISKPNCIHNLVTSTAGKCHTIAY